MSSDSIPLTSEYMANHASTDLNSKTLTFTCNMKNDIIIIIIAHWKPY